MKRIYTDRVQGINWLTKTGFVILLTLFTGLCGIPSVAHAVSYYINGNTSTNLIADGTTTLPTAQSTTNATSTTIPAFKGIVQTTVGTATSWRPASTSTGTIVMLNAYSPVYATATQISGITGNLAIRSANTGYTWTMHLYAYDPNGAANNKTLIATSSSVAVTATGSTESRPLTYTINGSGTVPAGYRLMAQIVHTATAASTGERIYYGGTTTTTGSYVTFTESSVDTTPCTVGTVTINPDVSSTYTSATPAISAVFSDAQSAVPTCEYTLNGGTNWTAGSITAAAPNYTCTANPASLSNGAFLTIKMRASSSGNSGTPTESATIQRTVDSSAPSDGTLTVTPGNASNALSWTEATDIGGSGVASYIIKYASGDTAPISCSVGLTVPGSPFIATARNTTHTPLTNGLAYSYRICAVDNYGRTSAGTIASGMPQAPPDDPTKVTSCTSCHFKKGVIDGAFRNHTGNFPGSHTLHASGSLNYACSVCHTGSRTLPGSTPQTAEYNHSNRLVDMQTTINSGSYNKTQPFAPSNTFTPATCNTTTCHGTSSPLWGNNSDNAQCTKCHGATNTAPATYAADNKLAAPGYSGGRDTGNTTDPADAQVGAHAVHLNANSNYITAIACTECHSSVNPDNTAFTGHMNGLATVSTGPRASMNTTGATYAAPNCSNYCHFSNPTGTYTPGSAIAWNNASLMNGTLSDCNKCHLSPPSSGGNHLDITTIDQCNGCHENVTTSGTFVNKAEHIDGIVQGGCNTCHAWPPVSNAHTVHINNIKSSKGLSGLPGGFVDNQVCGVCHNVSAKTKHAGSVGNDSTSRNIWLPAPYDNQTSYKFGSSAQSFAKGGTTTCSNVSCHLGSTPAWGTSPTTACQTCHGYPPVTTAGDLNNKHIGTAVNHKGQLSNASTATRFLSVHSGGCQICHGTQDNGSGGHAAYVTYTVATRHFAGTPKITMNSTLQYNTSNFGCDNAGCHVNNAEHQMSASGKTVDFFKGPVGAGGPDCLGCHNSIRGTRDAVAAEFNLAWGHKKSTHGPATNADCIVCHLEGNFTTKTTSDSFHANGSIDLRDPDGTGETLIKDNSNADFSFTKFAFDTTTRSATLTNSVADVLTHKFCLKCHDLGGATNTTARSGSSPTPTAPFGGGYTRYDAATAFAISNSSKHPIYAPLTKDFPTPAHFLAPYNGFTRAGTSGTKTAGIILNCFDCHNSPTVKTTRSVVAHGSSATDYLRGNATASGTPAAGTGSTLCLVCHTNNYTASNYSHGAGSAWSANTTRSAKAPYLQWGCNMCHASNYGTATTRPTRADDVHGTNVVLTGSNAFRTGGRWASTNAAQKVPIAFIRNSNQFNDHAPLNVAGTTYTPTCMGGASGASACTRTSAENYTVGGTY